MAFTDVTVFPVAALFLALVRVRQTMITINLFTPTGTCISLVWFTSSAKVLATILAFLHYITSLAIGLIAEITLSTRSTVRTVILLTIYTKTQPWSFIFSFTFKAETFQAFATSVIL